MTNQLCKELDDDRISPSVFTIFCCRNDPQVSGLFLGHGRCHWWVSFVYLHSRTKARGVPTPPPWERTWSWLKENKGDEANTQWLLKLLPRCSLHPAAHTVWWRRTRPMQRANSWEKRSQLWCTLLVIRIHNRRHPLAKGNTSQVPFTESRMSCGLSISSASGSP